MASSGEEARPRSPAVIDEMARRQKRAAQQPESTPYRNTV